eukprot:1193553-Prorocentrum_minimum.AAC.1
MQIHLFLGQVLLFRQEHLRVPPVDICFRENSWIRTSHFALRTSHFALRTSHFALRREKTVGFAEIRTCDVVGKRSYLSAGCLTTVQISRSRGWVRNQW